jgi:two-component system, NtrC family, nitrogen regulation response regulator GlnG
MPATRTDCPAIEAIIGEAPALRAVLARAVRVAPTRTSVLVTGESGTGKELLARALHELGPAPHGPFVAINCGALSRELAESELFGHERGAFTGAAGRRLGWFEEASGGTLVLDEVGELPLDLQPKLLRVLETGRLRRVGGTGEQPVRVRIVAMTLRDLRRECHRGAFRTDLFHRLAGFELTLPPLRQRRSDIAVLAHHFLEEVRVEMGTRTLSEPALARLESHDWPGNVRELRNVVRRATLLSEEVITPEALELDPLPELRLAHRAAEEAGAPEPGVLSTPAPGPRMAPEGDLLVLPGRTFLDMEKTIFSWALHRSGGSRRRAAQALGISRSTFCDRVKRLGLGPARAHEQPPGEQA